MKIKLWLIVVSLVCLSGCTYEAYNAVKPEPKAPDYIGSYLQFRILSALVSGGGGSTSTTQTCTVSTLAGSGSSGSTDGTGTAASFNQIYGLAVDSSGNVYVPDFNNNKIRKITSAGIVTTIAGSGSSGSTDATGTAASFNHPTGVAVDSNGNVFVADSDNGKIRKITSAGVVTTFASLGFSPQGAAVDGSGNFFVTDLNNRKIMKITSVGVVTTLAGSGGSGSTDATGTLASFSRMNGIAVENTGGNIYVADLDNNKIRKITSAGVVTTLAGSGLLGSTDGTGTAASFYSPAGIAIDSGGNVYVSGNNKIRKLVGCQ